MCGALSPRRKGAKHHKQFEKPIAGDQRSYVPPHLVSLHILTFFSLAAAALRNVVKQKTKNPRTPTNPPTQARLFLLTTIPTAKGALE